MAGFYQLLDFLIIPLINIFWGLVITVFIKTLGLKLSNDSWARLLLWTGWLTVFLLSMGIDLIWGPAMIVIASISGATHKGYYLGYFGPWYRFR